LMLRYLVVSFRGVWKNPGRRPAKPKIPRGISGSDLNISLIWSQIVRDSYSFFGVESHWSHSVFFRHVWKRSRVQGNGHPSAHVIINRGVHSEIPTKHVTGLCVVILVCWRNRYQPYNVLCSSPLVPLYKYK
jgi:hypothetical protein